MPGPYITRADLLIALKQDMRKTVSGLKPDWDGIADRAIARSWRDLKNRLMGKGYTEGQLDGWDDRVSFSMDQAIFYALTEGTDTFAADRDLSHLDHRKELEIPSFVGIMSNGVIITPNTADPEAMEVSTGSLGMLGDGTDLGTTFGIGKLRAGGYNEYGDKLPFDTW